jgi:hypothetical protein
MKNKVLTKQRRLYKCITYFCSIYLLFFYPEREREREKKSNRKSYTSSILRPKKKQKLLFCEEQQIFTYNKFIDYFCVFISNSS